MFEKKKGQCIARQRERRSNEEEEKRTLLNRMIGDEGERERGKQPPGGKSRVCKVNDDYKKASITLFCGLRPTNSKESEA